MLTINNAQFKSTGGSYPIYADGDLTIVVNGSAGIYDATEDGVPASKAIYVTGELNIQGEGKLIISDFDHEICSDERIIIDGTDIECFENEENFEITAPRIDFRNNCNLEGKSIYGKNIFFDEVTAQDGFEVMGLNQSFAETINIDNSDVSVEYIMSDKIYIIKSKFECLDTFDCKSFLCHESKFTSTVLFSDNVKLVSSEVLIHEGQTSSNDEESMAKSVWRIEDSILVSNVDDSYSNPLQGTIYDINKIIFISGKLDVTGIDDAFDPQPVFEIADGYKKVVDTKTHVVIDKDNGAGSGGTVPGTTTVAEKPITLDNKGTPVNAVITTQASDANGTPLPAGDLSSHVKVENNKVVFDKAKDMPELAGYTFKGWVSSGKKVSKIPANKLASMTVTATYVENVYNITYKLDKPKGTKVSAKAAPLKKVKYTEEKELTKDLIAANAKTGENYKLVGWATSKGGVKVYEPGQKISKIGGQTKKDKKVILYPVWEASK